MALLNFMPAKGLTPSLPGQQIWQNGVSSYLFGTNEVAWDPLALSNPAIMATVKAAGIPLIRVPLTASNANQRMSLIEQSGAQCLGILSWHHPDDALKVVQMLGKRCLLYEFGNEPDPLSQYITTWNANIAALRQANPNAKFIGPVLASPDANGIQKFLTSVKNNPPDVVSWHMYPCTNRTLQSCESGNHINFSKHTQEIGAVIQSVLGHDVPQAITEYNYDWQDGKTPNRDAATMQEFMTQSLNDMIQASKYGLVMANEYQLGGRAGAGTLDMVDPNSGAPLAQFAVLSQFIAKYRTSAAQSNATTQSNVTSTVDTTSPTITAGTANPTDTAIVTVTGTATPCADSSQTSSQGKADAPQSFTVSIAGRPFCCVVPPWMVADNGQTSMPTDASQREIRCVLIGSSSQQTTGTTPTATATDTSTDETETVTPTVSPSPTATERPAIAPLPMPTP